MSETTKSFDSYNVYYATNTNLKGRATILFFKGNTNVGYADFYDGAEQHEPKILNDGRIWLGYPLVCYSDVIELLRNEGPLTLRINIEKDVPNLGGIQTGVKMVGAGS